MANREAVNNRVASSSRESVFGAIQNARKDYLFGNINPKAGDRPIDPHRRNASSDYITARENYINSANADQSAIEDAVRLGLIHITPTSGRKFIQLGI